MLIVPINYITVQKDIHKLIQRDMFHLMSTLRQFCLSARQCWIKYTEYELTLCRATC